MPKELKIVRLLEPELCLKCRFSEVAEVDCNNGRTERMIHCRRGDCDNWDIVNAETATALRVLPE
jgi:hypothetical protein